MQLVAGLIVVVTVVVLAVVVGAGLASEALRCRRCGG